MWKHKHTGEIAKDKKGNIAIEQPIPYRFKFGNVICSKCNKPLQRGDVIAWPRSGENRGRYHQDCTDPRNSPWVLVQDEQPRPICTVCGNVEGAHRTMDAACPISAYEYHPSNKFNIPGVEKAPAIPEQFPGDKAYDMEIPDSPSSETEQASPSPKVSTGDGLLDLISSQVEAKVIDNVRRKVNTAIDAIDRSVKEKLDKLSIPSIILKRPNLPDVKIHNVHKQFKECLDYLQAGSYIYVHGAPGGHKSTLGPQLAEALGVRYGFMSLCEQTPEYVVRGCVLVNGEFYKPPFLDFLKNGGLWCWEECDNSNDNLRNSLNTVLENKKVCLDNGESFDISKDFYLMANGNTCGRGAHPAFPSRTAFDAAFAARFEYIEFEYDWSLCKHIALGLNKHSAPLVQWAEKVCNWSLANQVPLVMSPREVYKLAKLHALTDLPADKLLASMLKGLDLPSKEKMLANYPFPQITREKVSE